MNNAIIGHHNIVTQLQNAVTSGRIAGAYLFSGIKGLGKETTALYFAGLILCERNGESTSPCGECQACKKIERSNHPDLRIIRPDGAYIKIDQIRELQQQIIYQPLEGQRKLYILVNSDKLNKEAANCLLKTLEEPPSDSTIILLVENIESILPTIRSRCQVLPFYSMTTGELTESLMERFSIAEETATSAAILSGGVVGNAITLIGQDLTETIPEILEQTDLLSAFRLAEQFEKNLDSLDELIVWYRDLLFVQQDAPSELLTHINAYDKLQMLVPRYSRIRLQQAITTVFQTKELIKKPGMTKILALEVMCLKLLQSS